MTGPCAKRNVRCTIIAPDGERYVGGNGCLQPQPLCPRELGDGYLKCWTVCRQPGHAETVALSRAQGMARGGKAYLEGHTRACAACASSLARAGIDLVIGEPP